MNRHASALRFHFVLGVLLLSFAGRSSAQEPPPAPAAVPASASAPQPASPAAPTQVGSKYRDPLDGAFDYSEVLLFHRGFLPVPFLVTEPAVGYGGGLAAVFFRKSIAEMQQDGQAEGGRMLPPDVGAVMAYKTSNGSWGAGGGYFGSAAADRFRYSVLAAQTDTRLDFYGPRQIPRRFDIEAPYVKTDALARLGGSEWFVGARFLYFGATSRFVGDVPEEIAERELESDLGRLSLLVDYDSRDNVLTPSRGTFVEIDLGWARPEFASTQSFESWQGRGYTFVAAGERAVLGLRGDLRFSDGHAPFYAKPYLTLRGIAAMRYQGDDTALAETELRWSVTRRWGVVVFGGAGRAWSERSSFSEVDTAFGGGAGFRYLIARRLGLWAGVDVARGSGSDDTSLYFQVGSAWR